MSNFKRSDFFQKPQRYNITENTNKKSHIYSAGILPYQVDDKGKIYFLMGRDNENNWSDFGGKCEFKDNNNIKETAAREFFEESLNSIMDINTTREILRNENNYTLIESRTLSGSPYYMFVLRVPMLPDTCRDRFHKTLQYLKYIKTDSSHMEKNDIKWVSMDTILHCLDYPEYETKMGWPLRKIFRKTMINNRKILEELKNKNII
jgi:hypothetical protein